MRKLGVLLLLTLIVIVCRSAAPQEQSAAPQTARVSAEAGSAPREPAPSDAVSASVNCRGTRAALAVFAEPAADNIIGAFTCGESVSVLKKNVGPEGRMAEVRTDDGKDVYVDQAFLNLPASHSAEAAAPLVPKEPGLYTLGSGDSKLQRIEGRVTSFERSGSRLASAATVGIHAARTNTQIPGEHAHVTLSPTPGFYFRTDSRSEVEEEGLDLVLTRMTVKHGRRQFEVAAQGIWRSSKGISVRHQIDFDASEVEAGLYRIVPAQKLQEGQYAFYMLRGEEHASVMAGRGFVYDFQVE